MPKILAEYIDRLCTVEMRGKGKNIPRGVLSTFYNAALEEGGGDPLSFRAAELLINSCSPGKTVFIFCNAGVAPYLPYGETDGPLGGVAIAHAINAATGAIPVFISSDAHSPPVVSVARAAGFQVVEPDIALQRPRWAAIDERYNELDIENEKALELIERYDPVAMVSVECTAPNSEGVYCSILGFPVVGVPAYHNFFRIASDRLIPTIGVGDGGNEIGCGRILKTVRELRGIPVGGNDPAATIKTDVLFFAGVSNWGGYGIAAMIAFLSENPKAFHSDVTERRMLDAVVSAGAADGAEASLNPNVDMIDNRVHIDLVNILHTMVMNALQPLERPF
ncbi:glutamate cyclase domain-containing protein [Parahaliea mediterranea]|uniref:DUF4392 domain-containing protein n=1 Tax=Parahaliea mediterranea TaxID=651086 RepID=A0A939IMV3_9GAMM|nr:glutamate cyclase domain-containing protein [Parahaliea mediterranea]MBN7797387.1 DUF4392 domain-containing protein [Parahaliea mediterranea]